MELGSPNHSLNSVQLEKCTIDDEPGVTPNDVMTSSSLRTEITNEGTRVVDLNNAGVGRTTKPSKQISNNMQNAEDKTPLEYRMTNLHEDASVTLAAGDQSHLAYVNPTLNMPELEWGNEKLSDTSGAGVAKQQRGFVVPSNESGNINDIVELESVENSSTHPNARYWKIGNTFAIYLL